MKKDENMVALGTLQMCYNKEIQSGEPHILGFIDKSWLVLTNITVGPYNIFIIIRGGLLCPEEKLSNNNCHSRPCSCFSISIQ